MEVIKIFPIPKNYEETHFVVENDEENMFLFDLSLTSLLPLFCKSQGAAGISQDLILNSDILTQHCNGVSLGMSKLKRGPKHTKKTDKQQG